MYIIYSDSVRREEIEELGLNIGPRWKADIYSDNLIYADDTTLCAESQEDAERKKERLTILAKQIEMVEHFLYLGALKSAVGNSSKDTRSRIGMANIIMLDP